MTPLFGKLLVCVPNTVKGAGAGAGAGAAAWGLTLGRAEVLIRSRIKAILFWAAEFDESSWSALS